MIILFLVTYPHIFIDGERTFTYNIFINKLLINSNKNMSKYTLKKEIHREIKNINALIDMRIIKGISYKDLSRRHKFLISQLNSLKSRKETYSRILKPVTESIVKNSVKTSNKNTLGFFGMLGRYVSAFLF